MGKIRWWLYRHWSLFIHKFNYHHMSLSYPDGDTVAWCHWCGIRCKLRTKAEQETLTKALNKLANYGEAIVEDHIMKEHNEIPD